MPITIVSVLPKSVQNPSPGNSIGTENAAPGQDFASMLLGQIFQGLSGISTSTTLGGSVEAETTENTASGQDFESMLLGQAFQGLSGISTSTTPGGSVEAETTENTASGQDFESMLLGQAFQGLSEISTGATAGGPVEAEATDNSTGENAPPNDALALLATFSTPAVEQRNDGAAAMPQPLAGTIATTVLQTGNDTALSTSPNADSADTASQLLRDAASPENAQRAAKFAVSAIIPGDDNSATSASQSAEPAMNATNPGTSHIASLPSGHTNGQQASTVTSLPIPAPLRDQNWNSDFAQKIVWLATSNKQAAELTLNPPNMGSIEVSLRIDNDKATATFVSTNADVRETIETALPRLREMLAGVGIELGQANVSAESFRQAFGQGNQGNDASHARNDNAILAPGSQGAQSSGQAIAISGKGLVDLFA